MIDDGCFADVDDVSTAGEGSRKVEGDVHS